MLVMPKQSDCGTVHMAQTADDYCWMDDALCIGMFALGDKNPFFKLNRGRGARYSKARSLCAKCPVVIDCLIEGLQVDNVGFWGCTNDAERVRIRRTMSQGLTFVDAVESVWEPHRKLKVQVPPTSVWKDWNV